MLLTNNHRPSDFIPVQLHIQNNTNFLGAVSCGEGTSSRLLQ